MPSDPAAAVDVDHAAAVGGPVRFLGALARGVDRRVLQKQEHVVVEFPGRPLRRQGMLQVVGVLVVDDAHLPDLDR
ncbi:MAG: hypothetical protein QM703_19150 [Gemmatales bacterium]